MSRMTLDEKISWLGHRSPGISRLGIPEYNWWNEGMHGISRAGVATVFPQSIALAASWDAENMWKVADAVSTEARAKHHEHARRGDRGIYKGLTLWSPNINIYRDPRWGRGHETYGEDPYLTGSLGQAFVKGIQGNHPVYLKAVATPKHFAVHSGPEKDRHSFDSMVSAKDLAETYLPAFRRCVEAGAASVMGAYNRVNGQAACASPVLLRKILREAWGFDGYVVSDCGAIADISEYHGLAGDLAEAAALALKAGCDLSCGFENNQLNLAMQRGQVSEADIDTALRRTMRARFLLGMFDDEAMNPWALIPYERLDAPEHRLLARTSAAAGMVLLKNDGILPLSKEIGTIAVIGPNARCYESLVANYHGTPSSYSTPLDGIRAVLESCPVIARHPETDGIINTRPRVLYAEGCHHSKTDDTPWGESARAGITEAVIAAGRSDVVVLMLGLTPLLEGEQGDAANADASGDRLHLGLPGVQNELLQAVLETGKPVIVVLMNGGSLSLPAYALKASALMEAWYPGEEGGSALADILFGDINPSGRLPLTFYKSLEDLPPFEEYSMKNRTYRYFRGQPAFPFGFGLSYTTFKYSDLRMPAKVRCGEDFSFKVRLGNCGKRDGHEVVQVYASRLDELDDQPIRSLVAFRRVFVPAGSDMDITMNIEARDLAIFDIDGCALVRPGMVNISVGGCQPDVVSASLGGAEVVSARFELTGPAYDPYVAHKRTGVLNGKAD